MREIQAQSAVRAQPALYQPTEPRRPTHQGGRPRLYLAAHCPRPLGGTAPAHDFLPILNEDLAPMTPILHAFGLTAAYRLEGESDIRPLPGPAATTAASDFACESALRPAIPLFSPDGRRHCDLGVLRHQNGCDENLNVILQASLSLTAQTITERWFRLKNQRAWILAAAPLSNPRRWLLLALDQKLAVVTMDSHATERVAARAEHCDRPLWEDFFEPLSPVPTLRARADIPLRLVSAHDGETWTAILTSPDLTAGMYSHDALLHARPRAHALADLMRSTPKEPLQIPSLTPGMRRKIEDYIEAHIELPLTVERLAQAAGMSCSHFTKAFRNVLKMTPHRYVMWRRLVRAQELIRGSDASLAEIALTTGFSDQSHLCRLFQLHIGESPSRFRRRHR